MNTDMQFAAMCGFKKLFVGTGADTINDAKLENEYPDFYIPSLAMLQPLIDLYLQLIVSITVVISAVDWALRKLT